jgi:ribosomal protein S12 methylthiotransferase accessory factor
MSSDLTTTYNQGTWRLCPPEQTLSHIQPLLHACGITRCADVTHLDNIGIPVYCAIRPTAAVLQVSNGKGLTHASAKVSALMEAIEFFHCEHPESSQLHSNSMQGLQRNGQSFVNPASIAGYMDQNYHSDAHVMEWVQAQNLITGEPTHVPASAVYFHRIPSLHVTTTNGLASGNHLTEATLHALYELIERDAAASLLGQARIPIKERCQVVDLTSIDDIDLKKIIQMIHQSGSKLVLLRVESAISIYTFWAILMNEASWISGSTFNTGWGTHLDPGIAASRAITEAVQSRVTMVHGAREDALIKPVFRKAQEVWGSKAFQFFMKIVADTQWNTFKSKYTETKNDINHMLKFILNELNANGHSNIFRCDLTKENIKIPVVRLIAPSLKLRVS